MAILEQQLRDLHTAAHEYERPGDELSLEQMGMDLGNLEFAEIPLDMSPVLTAESMPPQDRERDANGRKALLARVKDEIEAFRRGNERGLAVTDETQIPGLVLAEILLPDQSIYGDPSVLGRIMDEIDEWIMSTGSTESDDGSMQLSNTVQIRMAYNGKAPAIYDALAQGISYNRPVDEQKNAGNINLAWPEMRGLREGAKGVYAREPVTVILPAAKEPITGHRAIEYASDMVGGENVVAVSAGFCETTTQRMAEMGQETGADFAMQTEILRGVNWQMIGEKYGLPYDAADPYKPPAGTKGLTMLAAMLRAEATGKLDKDVVFIDTDIVNQGEGGYDPLAYLALPYMEENHPELIAAYNARTGRGRNNEPVTIVLNHIAQDAGMDAEVRKTAMMMAATMPWLLTGERRIAGDVIRRVPWVPNMSIEMQINAFLAGMQVESGRFGVAQVFDPNPKVEKGESVASREFPLIDRCALWGNDVLRFCNQHGVLPHQIEEAGLIADFNRQFGGRPRVGFYQNEMHAPNTSALIKGDYMLPSIQGLRELEGAVNWDAIAQASRTMYN